MPPAPWGDGQRDTRGSVQPAASPRVSPLRRHIRIQPHSIPRALVSTDSHLTRLSRIALLVGLGDFLTKQVAQLWVERLDVSTTALVRFGVVHNDKAAFGMSAGAYTFQLNLALTLAAIALIVPVSRDLSKIDRHAPAALGLIAGGALGNLTSLVLSPRGVVDFIAVMTGEGRSIVLNVADVGAYVGLAIMMRTAFLIVRAIRRDRARTKNRPLVLTEFFSPLFADAELSRPVFTDQRVSAMPAREERQEPVSRRSKFPLLSLRPSDDMVREPREELRRPLGIEAHWVDTPHSRPMSHPEEMQ
jgi:lipoprotein signal peptidase